MIKVLFLATAVLFTGLANGQVLNDPTRPLKGAGAKGSDGTTVDENGFPGINVSAVFINGRNKHAILDGQDVKEGQNWRGMTLIQVHQEGVILANQQGRREYLITNNNIKKDSVNEF